MNDDHRADSVLICQMLGSMPAAVDAQAVDVDPSGMRFQVTLADGRTAAASVTFATPAHERAQVRVAVVELYERACAVAGVTPREH